MDGRRRDSGPTWSIPARGHASMSRGNVYILERWACPASRRSRREVHTLVGTGEKGSTGDGATPAWHLERPQTSLHRPTGNVLIADTENHVIRKYLPANGKIQRVAGHGQKGANGLDGSPFEAGLSQPHGVYVHSSGVLYISDSSNHRVVKIDRSQLVERLARTV